MEGEQIENPILVTSWSNKHNKKIVAFFQMALLEEKNL